MENDSDCSGPQKQPAPLHPHPRFSHTSPLYPHTHTHTHSPPARKRSLARLSLTSIGCDIRPGMDARCALKSCPRARGSSSPEYTATQVYVCVRAVYTTAAAGQSFDSALKYSWLLRTPRVCFGGGGGADYAGGGSAARANGHLSLACPSRALGRYTVRLDRSRSFQRDLFANRPGRWRSSVRVAG